MANIPHKITLEAARKNAGYTQEEAAQLIGIHSQSLSKYENDSTNLTFGIAEKLCKLYGFPMDYIFFKKKSDINRISKPS